MRIFYFPIYLTIIIDIIAWLIIHLGVSYFTYCLPIKLFEQESWFYKERKWEKAGNIYKVIFKIKNWKQLLPDGAILFKKGFQKSRLENSTLPYLKTFRQ